MGCSIHLVLSGIWPEDQIFRRGEEKEAGADHVRGLLLSRANHQNHPSVPEAALGLCSLQLLRPTGTVDPCFPANRQGQANFHGERASR